MAKAGKAKRRSKVKSARPPRRAAAGASRARRPKPPRAVPPAVRTRAKAKAAGKRNALARKPAAAPPTAAPVPPSEPLTPSRRFALEAARLMHDDKCDDVVVLDVRNLCQVADYIVVGSGTSDRQMRAVMDHLKRAGATQGYQPFRSDVDDTATWCLVDFVDVVAHVFEPNTRAHYDLEMLWGDAPRVPWARPGDAAPRATDAAESTGRGRSRVVPLPA